MGAHLVEIDGSPQVLQTFLRNHVVALLRKKSFSLLQNGVDTTTRRVERELFEAWIVKGTEP